MSAPLETVFAGVDRVVRGILERALDGRTVTVDEAVALCGARGPSLHALASVADHLRRAQVGDRVAYVVNRNVNFTNVCVKACSFCAFSRTRRSEEGYLLPAGEIVRRVLEAEALGATEVCIQAGLAPGVDARFYVGLVRAIKAEAPRVHIHAEGEHPARAARPTMALARPRRATPPPALQRRAYFARCRLHRLIAATLASVLWLGFGWTTRRSSASVTW